MSNRKDLKKTLGLPEYPWSSDDDENENLATNEPNNNNQHSTSRSQDNEYQYNAALETHGESLPSTSSSTHQSRKAEARNERDIFWNLINSPNVPNVTSVSRPRPQEPQFPSSARSVVHVPSAELREDNSRAVSDIRRMLALKKLSAKTLMYLQHKAKASKLMQSALRGNSSSSRVSSISQPSPSRPNYKFAKIRRTHSSYASYSRGQNASATSRSSAAEAVLPSSSGYLPPHRSPDGGETTHRDVRPPVNVEANVEHQIDGDIGHHELSSSGGVSLEDIVEIDPEPDVSAVEQSGVNDQNSIIREQSQDTLDAPDGESSRRGVKRKSDELEVVGDTEALQELNQSLLRLLECPVCLEWSEPPISQCRRGHLVCSRCRSRIASCPVCRTGFSSVRNRAMEGVAEMLRYPCRHGCGREVKLRRRTPHEASCPARCYMCPAPQCAQKSTLLAQNRLLTHFQKEHPAMLLIGSRHKLSVLMNSEQSEHWFISAHQQVFNARVDVDVRSWGLVVHVAFLGPKCRAKDYVYQVTVIGQHNERQITYSRTTHNDLENHYVSTSRQDCFHLTLDQALNFLRNKNKSAEVNQTKRLEFFIEVKKSEIEEVRDEDTDS